MSRNSTTVKDDHRRRICRWHARVSGHLMGAALGAAAFAVPALAAPPPAGTVIGNQAVATFESGGQTYSITSNLVETTINTIAGVQIASDTTKSGAVGGKVFFPHTITNIGNSADSFTLTTPVVDAGLTVVAIYPDANCDGVPDTLTAITATPSLSSGQQFCVVTEVDVASSVTVGASATYQIMAETTLSGSVTMVAPDDTNTDTVNFANTAVFEFTKNMTLLTDADASGSLTPGDTVRVRINYNNTGLAAGTGVVITDPLPAELVYLAGTGVWSDGGTMTDDPGDGVNGTNGQGDTIDYGFATGQVTATISSVPAGRAGYVQFDATISADASGTVTNVASIDSNETDPQDSNSAAIDVVDEDAVFVTLADSATVDGLDDGSDPDTNLGGTPASSTDDGPTNNDVVSETSPYAEGAVVPFSLVIENHSNTPQRFDLNAAVGSFPAGTSFSFFTDTGAVVFDTNANGMPDIPLPAHGTRQFELRADLPAGPGTTRLATDTPWQAQVTATALTDPNVSNNTTIELANDITGAAVDLENAGGLADGPSVDNGGNPWTTETADSGETVSFTLVVQNNGASPDSFNLAYSDTNFTDGTLPAGWQVTFKDSTGAAITNTGVIAAGSSATFTAEVKVPPSATPGDTALFFRAMSATNSAVSDIKMDRVTVNMRADLAIRANATAQSSPGGVVVLSHTIENVGNTAYPVPGFYLEYDTPFSNFGATLYVDSNENGVLDPADALVVDENDEVVGKVPGLGGSLEPGETITVFARIQVPSTAVAGLSETATLQIATAEDNIDNSAVTETVTVVSGDLEVVKEQAIDADCDGTEDAAFSQAPATADPGACIIYRINATNTGSADAENVRIDDEVPQFTTIAANPTPAATGGSAPAMALAPAAGSTGAVRSTHGVLIPGGVATLTFGVRIDQ